MNNNDFDTLEINEIPNATNGLQIFQQDRAFIDIQIATAKQYPRNLQRAIQNAITIVTLDAETADLCTYSLKKGGKTITGPSVNLAKIIAQQMGNMRIENRVVGYDSSHVTCEAICFDLERNFAVRTQIKKSIIGSSGRYSEDMAVITGNAGNSIALRNAVFAVIDAGIVKKVYNAAKQKITGDVSDENKLMSRRNTVVAGFKSVYSSYKLTDEEIAGAVGKTVIEHITADDLVVLIGFEKTLQSGEITVESVFRPQVPNKPVARPVVGDKSASRILELIAAAKDIKSLEKLHKDISTNEARIAYDEAYLKLKI